MRALTLIAHMIFAARAVGRIAGFPALLDEIYGILNFWVTLPHPSRSQLRLETELTSVKSQR